MKKKRLKDYPELKRIIGKGLLIMRLSLILMVVGVLQSAASVYSQNWRMSMNEKSIVVKDVLTKIENSSEFRFFYEEKKVNVEKKVDVVTTNATIDDIMSLLFNSEGIEYRVLDSNYIVLKPKGDSSSSSINSSQQKKSITGKVIDKSGTLLPGVSVVIKGSATGVITDSGGTYSISNIPANASLQFSFIGMKKQEITIGNSTVINVVLEEETIGINEVVVTALGIEKSAKTLTYTVQKVGGEELTKVSNPNIMNSIEGKVAGLTLNKASGVGGGVKIVIRGNKSIQRNNQPLYVIDGMPMTNNRSESVSSAFNSLDNGDGISNLNSEDIESINVLKGASAAALYGSQAANGVILLTTKRGKAGVTKIDFTSTASWDNAINLPKLQNSYGQSAKSAEDSWGAPILSCPDNISGFFKTGTTFMNTISLSSGNENMQTYLSLGNTTSKGIIENNNLSRNNIFLRESANFFKNKLIVEASANLIFQKINNPPSSGTQYTSIASLYLFPRGLDLSPYKEFEKFNPDRNINTQNWYITPSSGSQNPYWITNRMLRENQRNRTMLKLSLKYNIANWLNFQVRGNLDKTLYNSETKLYYGTTPNYAYLNGYYEVSRTEDPTYYADALFTSTHSFGEKFKINAVIGASITDSHNEGQYANSTVLKIPNVFIMQNMMMQTGTSIGSSTESHQQLQALFGNFSLYYDEWLGIDVTGRNDWSSNLSFTPNGSYFYPSFGFTGLLHEVVSLPKVISFAKVRASYAIVGNTVPVYVTNPLSSLNSGGIIAFNNTTPFTDLKPEMSKAFEIGTEIKFFKNEFSVDFSYYKTNTINQFFTVAVPPGTGYSYRYVNGGDIQNSGVELVVGYSPIPKNALRWSSFVNFSANKSLVKELAEGFDQFVINDDLSGYANILKVGGSYGDIYGQTLKRDSEGRIIISATGIPVASGTKDLLGNSSPKFQLGWNNNISYKNFSLSFLIDGRFGGKVMSLTEANLDFYGVSKVSGEARDNGGIHINGVVENTSTPVTTVDPQKWYSNVSRSAVGEYMYDATTISLREFSFGYSFPTKRMNMNKVNKLNLSLIGRNLIYFYKPAPFDPENTYSTGNGFSGVDIFTLPSTRSLGIKLDVSF